MKLYDAEKILWLAIALYWLVASFSVKKSIKKQSGWQRMAYTTCLFFAFTLLFQDYYRIGLLYKPVLPQNVVWKTGGFLFCAGGLLFALFARIWLGKNWSGRITIKENHELIQSGPYFITRNPIYTGFLTAFLGCSMTLGLLKGYLGVFLLVICLELKISKEEFFMQEVFGEKWKLYRSKVKRLIPGIY